MVFTPGEVMLSNDLAVGEGLLRTLVYVTLMAVVLLLSACSEEAPAPFEASAANHGQDAEKAANIQSEMPDVSNLTPDSEVGHSLGKESLSSIAADTSRVHAFTLREGRSLAWAEYGDPEGLPVFELHGGGASHLSGLVYHREALAEGVRIISVDRPGAASSTFNSELSVAGFYTDLEQLADHLKLQQFVVMGNSNGGMFSIALAHAMPERVLGAIVINPATPVFDDPQAWELTPIYHTLVKANLEEYVEGVHASIDQMKSNPDLARQPPFYQLPHNAEVDISTIYFAAIELTPVEVFKQEAQLVLNQEGWGFDIFDVKPRVEIFTGEFEVGTPFNKIWVTKLPDAGLHATTGGHLGQLAPETRQRIVLCVKALSARKECGTN